MPRVRVSKPASPVILDDDVSVSRSSSSSQSPTTEQVHPESPPKRSVKQGGLVGSIVEGMSYGQVRVGLNQIWRTRWQVKPKYMLQNGMTVGEFTLKYVLALLSQRKRKAARPRRQEASS